MSTADIKTLWRSFAGGEITPELYARLDLAKFQTALALCRNFIVLPHGPAANRGGTEYVLETKNSLKRSRLIPFVTGDDDAFEIELGDEYMRFHKGSSTLVEPQQDIENITAASPAVVTITAHGFGNGNWLFLAGIDGMADLNGRWVKVANKTADTFELQDLAGLDISTVGQVYHGDGTASRVYEIDAPWDEAHVAAIKYAQDDSVLTLTHPLYNEQELRRTGAVAFELTEPSYDPTISAPTGVLADNTVGSTERFYHYVVTAITADGEESFSSGTASASNNLWTAGNFNTISWSAVAGANRYNVYKVMGDVPGYIGQATHTHFEDENINPDSTKTPPEASDPFGSAGNYPRTVTHFQQRRVFCGTLNKPQTVWMTRSGTTSNMASSLPVQDDDAISFKIASLQATTIRHVVPLDDLILLTASSVWRVAPANSDVITPSSISAKVIDYTGASDVQPVVTGSSVLFGAAGGGHVIELRYSFEQQGVRTKDTSLLAPHLFDDFEIVSMAFQSSPYRIAWNVRSDGKLVGLTYVPEQEVQGWHQHDTKGAFESVCVTPQGGRQVATFIIKRTINGRQVRYVERLDNRQFATAADAFFVDSGLRYSGAPVQTLSGFAHLEGETLAVLADGAVHPPLTVVGGKITMQVKASKVSGGIPITADLQTLPFYYESAGFGVGEMKNVNAVHLRVRRSSSILAGPSFERLLPVKQRTSEHYGSPPALLDGPCTVSIESSWNEDSQVCIRQADPLPLMILSLGPEVALCD